MHAESQIELRSSLATLLSESNKPCRHDSFRTYPYSVSFRKTILIQRRRRGERESRRLLSQHRWHRRYCAASSVEEDVSANEMNGVEANRLELDLEASSRDELQQEEEEEEESGGEFPHLPEEFKNVRGAFLDGPGQYLDVEKILAQTDHIDHTDIPEGFRTGYVTIVGSPNVGKSTLMNNMIGDRLSIVTPKVGDKPS